MSLEPIRCTACGAALPLLHGAAFACPFCGAHVAVPAAYRDLFAVHAREEAAHHELEQRYAAVARPPPRWLDHLAVLLVLCGPAIAGASCVRLSADAMTIVPLFAYAIVPALVPGTGLWIWSAAVHATIVRFQLALAADPPATSGGPPRCRQCGAPLALAAGAIAAHCAYCGTDSLTDHVASATARIESTLRGELRTLADAAAALRVRRRLLVAGVTLAMLLLGAFVAELLGHIH